MGLFNESQVHQALVKNKGVSINRHGGVERVFTSEISVSLKL